MRFAPPGAFINGTYDYCAGVNEEQLFRPPTPQWVQTVSAVLLALAVFVLILSSSLWYKFRHIPHLALGRVFLLSKCMDMGLVCMMCAVYLRFITLKPNGQSSQTCVGTVGLYITGAFFPTNAYYLRLLVLLIKTRRAQLIQQYNAASDEDDASLNASTAIETHSMSYSQYLVFIVSSMFALDDNSVLHPKNALYRAGEILKTRALVIMTLCIFFIMFIPMVVLPFVVDAYRGGCTGCPLYFDFLIAYIVVWVPLFPLAFRLNMMVYKEADEYDVNHELISTIIIGSIFCWPGVILIAVDPSQIDYNYQFMWEWMIAFGWIATVSIWGPIQIAWGVHKYIQHQRQPSAEYVLARLNVGALIKDLKNPRFLEIAKRQYVNENIQFLLDTTYWRSQYFDRNPQWRQKKAEHISDMFVKVGSTMEINIADRERRQLLADIATGRVTDTLFKEAEKQVAEMLLQGAWKTYVIESYDVEEGVHLLSKSNGAVIPRSETRDSSAT